MLYDHRLRELDGIRGIACLLVIFDHIFFSNLSPDLIPGYWRISAWLLGGVDLFFVLSGFLIGGILLDHKHAGNYFRVFWARRIARIMPVYYLLFATFCLALLLRPWLHAPWLDVYLLKNHMPVWTYAVFVQNFAQALDGGDGGARWVASTWSLAIEEQFYLLLPPLAYLMGRKELAMMAAVGIVVALLARTYLWEASGSWFTPYFLLPSRMDALLAGLAAALALRHVPTFGFLQRHRLGVDFIGILAAVILCTSLVGPSGYSDMFIVRGLDFTFRSVFFAYVIVRVFLVPEGSLYRRFLSARLLVFSGTISYALYMYHPAINGLLHGLIFGDEPKLPDLQHLMVAVAVVALSVGLAWLSTTYYELPIRRLAGRMRYRDGRPPVAAQPIPF